MIAGLFNDHFRNNPNSKLNYVANRKEISELVSALQHGVE